jgi:exoribonuclease-2
MPEGISPLLPDAALERYGLGLSESSPALSFKIGLDAEGAIASVEALASTLAVRRTHYAAADELMDSGGVPELVELSKIAALRQARRVAAGAVEIDIPEVRVYVRDNVIRIERLPETRSSGLVREIMLLAGEAAARWAFERRLAFPFYGQEAPADSGDAARGSGLSAEFAKRRLMRGGILGPTPSAHRGLGLPFYAQVTSPLRRYQDLLGHMQIRAVLEGRETLDADEVARRCALAQAAQAATRQAERGSELHWTLAYLKRNPDWMGEGIIVGQVGAAAYQVYIPELGLETRLKLGSGRGLDESLSLRLARVELSTLESSFDELELHKG